MPMWITWNSALKAGSSSSSPHVNHRDLRTTYWATAMLKTSSTEPTYTQPTVYFIKRVVLSALKIHMNKCTIMICLH